VTAIPCYRPHSGPAVLSAGFRPFFLLAELWAAIAVPLWLALFAGETQIPTAFSPTIWHAHEMVFGYGAAVVAGFLLTAIPNWTGRMPLQGSPLAALALIWVAGRMAVLISEVVSKRAARPWGRPLGEHSVVRMVYLDESGISAKEPILVVAGASFMPTSNGRLWKNT
jgi:uncharacterized protein involved in response to NO